MVRALIFDLDNTLVASDLDFEAMKEEMGLRSSLRLLEAINELPPPEAERCYAILRRHEREGATRATLLPGVKELLHEAQQRNWKVGIATRNSREIAHFTLDRLQIAHHGLVSRDDGPIKPHPWPVEHLCNSWGIPPARTVMIGDYRFDVESGRDAGAHTVLLTGEVPPCAYPNEERAGLLLHSLADFRQLLQWIDQLPTGDYSAH